MSVLITIAFIAIAVTGALAVQSRLAQLRNQVSQAWKLFDADQTKTPARNVYNAHVDAYNRALETFPYSVIASLTGFKPARRFNPQSAIRTPPSEI